MNDSKALNAVLAGLRAASLGLKKLAERALSA